MGHVSVPVINRINIVKFSNFIFSSFQKVLYVNSYIRDLSLNSFLNFFLKRGFKKKNLLFSYIFFIFKKYLNFLFFLSSKKKKRNKKKNLFLFFRFFIFYNFLSKFRFHRFYFLNFFNNLSINNVFLKKKLCLNYFKLFFIKNLKYFFVFQVKKYFNLFKYTLIRIKVLIKLLKKMLLFIRSKVKQKRSIEFNILFFNNFIRFFLFVRRYIKKIFYLCRYNKIKKINFIGQINFFNKKINFYLNELENKKKIKNKFSFYFRRFLKKKNFYNFNFYNFFSIENSLYIVLSLNFDSFLRLVNYNILSRYFINVTFFNLNYFKNLAKT